MQDEGAGAGAGPPLNRKIAFRGAPRRRGAPLLQIPNGRTPDVERKRECTILGAVRTDSILLECIVSHGALVRK